MTKKEDTPNITYSVDSDSLTGGWAPSPENFSVSFSEGDQLDFNLEIVAELRSSVCVAHFLNSLGRTALTCLRLV